MHWFTLLLVAIVAFYVILPKLRQAPMEAAVAALRKGAPFIDVRTTREYQQQSIPGSVNLPLGSLQEGIRQMDFPREQPVLVFCLSGTRSSAAERQLRSMGYENVMNVGSFRRAQQAYRASTGQSTQ